MPTPRPLAAKRVQKSYRTRGAWNGGVGGWGGLMGAGAGAGGRGEVHTTRDAGSESFAAPVHAHMDGGLHCMGDHVVPVTWCVGITGLLSNGLWFRFVFVHCLATMRNASPLNTYG